jgi:hypothetical protein
MDSLQSDLSYALFRGGREVVGAQAVLRSEMHIFQGLAARLGTG